MISSPTTSDFTILNFADLLASDKAFALLNQLNALVSDDNINLHQTISHDFLTDCIKTKGLDSLSLENNEITATDWLIKLFNTLFVKHNVQLVRGTSEPEYFPATDNHPARIEFAHGFFASALHEISHWCVAGQKRRLMSDFGYWYAADGRSQDQQRAFERVEVKPQALECLFTLACLRPFQVSQDNLFADFDTSSSTFTQDVYNQVNCYIAQPQSLPKDAQILLAALIKAHNPIFKLKYHLVPNKS